MLIKLLLLALPVPAVEVDKEWAAAVVCTANHRRTNSVVALANLLAH